VSCEIVGVLSAPPVWAVRTCLVGNDHDIGGRAPRVVDDCVHDVAHQLNCADAYISGINGPDKFGEMRFDALCP
jgi:hypothetical protein